MNTVAPLIFLIIILSLLIYFNKQKPIQKTNIERLKEQLENYLGFLFSDFGFKEIYSHNENSFDWCRMVLGSQYYNLRFYVDRGTIGCEIGTPYATPKSLSYSNRKNLETGQESDLKVMWYPLNGNYVVSVIDYINKAPFDSTFMTLRRKTDSRSEKEQLEDIAGIIRKHFNDLTELFNYNDFENSTKNMFEFFDEREAQFKKEFNRIYIHLADKETEK